ncbi:MAG: hypothetical protein Q9196_001826 [Gyalolechia fulgens]
MSEWTTMIGRRANAEDVEQPSRPTPSPQPLGDEQPATDPDEAATQIGSPTPSLLADSHHLADLYFSDHPEALDGEELLSYEEELIDLAISHYKSVNKECFGHEGEKAAEHYKQRMLDSAQKADALWRRTKRKRLNRSGAKTPVRPGRLVVRYVRLGVTPTSSAGVKKPTKKGKEKATPTRLTFQDIMHEYAPEYKISLAA